MKWICLGLLMLAALSVQADVVGPEQVEDMLEQMIRENVISEVQGEKAKIKLRAMNEDQWKEMNRKARKIASRSPASIADKLPESTSADLDSAQFIQIQHEMRNIIPNTRR